MSNVVNVIYTPNIVYPHPCFHYFFSTNIMICGIWLKQGIEENLQHPVQTLSEKTNTSQLFNEPSITMTPKPTTLQENYRPTALMDTDGEWGVP